MKQYTRNILKVYSKCKHDELQHGLTWYRDANQWCNAVAIEHKLPLHVVVGVVAALSPTNRWSRNLIDANNLIETFINGGYVEDCKSVHTTQCETRHGIYYSQCLIHQMT